MSCDWSELLAAAPRWVLVANLPYNVATPLVLDLLCGAPAIGRMLVMVQREAGERLVAVPGGRNFGAVSVRVGYFATAALVGQRLARGVPAPPECRVGARGARATRVAGGGPRRGELRGDRPPPPGGLRRAQEDAPPLARGAGRRGHLRGGRDRRPFPGRGARHRGVGQASRMPSVDHFRAPAKLTRTLRVVGVRPDGYHLLEAEMATIDLADELEIEQGADGLEVVDAVSWVLGDGPSSTGQRRDGATPARAVVPLGAENLVSRALAAVGPQGPGAADKAHSGRSRPRRWVADAAAVLRWAGVLDPAVAAGLGADVPFCVVGGRALVTGVGELVEPLAFEAFTAVLVTPELTVSTPEVYRAWDALGGPTGEHGNDLEPAAVVVEPRFAWWRDMFAAVAGDRAAVGGKRWHVVSRARAGSGRASCRRAPRRRAGRAPPSSRCRCVEHRSRVTRASWPCSGLANNKGSAVPAGSPQRATCRRRVVASGCASTSSYASSCAFACGAS